MLKLIPLLLLAVISCSTLAGEDWDQHDPYYEWEKKPSQPPMGKIYYIVSVKEWQDLCDRPSDACALRKPELNTCYIISPKPITDIYLDWHERKHCAGYINHKRRGGMK